jgi:hypothetical protein
MTNELSDTCLVFLLLPSNHASSFFCLCVVFHRIHAIGYFYRIWFFFRSLVSFEVLLDDEYDNKSKRNDEGILI